ncbi:PTS sugar transporter subunit IIA [Tetragenococcus halophilus]|uniref:PTS galactosamine/N-acetylgalactosamine transporter subunit IIA n=1 Tax=Tetragenococcus halophilus TaxID=51669 RepID=UPI00077C4029|nr:PTS galactosamine/N-acetylgalactosamine transporter subunit IIA [Tetragenococcus halophilus]MCF1685391.1 PTS sugar transporter subunit IIA [Tetragenococcus halophilus]
MLGIIVTGHGQFATGLQSSVELIAGKQEKFEAINFEEGESSEDLNNKLKKVVSQMDSKEGVIIFTDIPGGTPFNQSILLSQEDKQIKVVAGANLPAIMDGIFNRRLEAGTFVEKVLQSGKNGLVTYEGKKKSITEEEGI